MPEPSRGVLDTSVVIDHDLVDIALLPDESAITAITLAELAAGPHATDDDQERARRQDRLQWAAATWNLLAFDADWQIIGGRNLIRLVRIASADGTLALRMAGHRIVSNERRDGPAAALNR